MLKIKVGIRNLGDSPTAPFMGVQRLSEHVTPFIPSRLQLLVIYKVSTPVPLALTTRVYDGPLPELLRSSPAEDVESLP